MNRFQAQERVGNLANPRPSVTAPVVRDDVVEHRSPRLPFELQRLEAWEPPAQAAGSGGVAEGDGDVLARDGVDLVPLLADERDGVPIPRVVDVVHHALQSHVGDPGGEARRSDQVPSVHR